MVTSANLAKIRRFLTELEALADGTLVVVNQKPALLRDKARAEAQVGRRKLSSA